MTHTLIKYLFFLFLFFIPLQTRWIYEQAFIDGEPFEFATRSVYATEILLWIIFLFGVSYIVRFFSLPSKIFPEKNLRRQIIISLLAFITLSFVSIAWATNKPLSLQTYFRIIEGAALCMLLLSIPLNFRKLLIALVSSGVVQSILALWQFFTQKVFASTLLGMASQLPSALGASVVENSTGRFLRAYGSLPHPNMLGGFLVVTVLLNAYLLICSNKGIERKIYSTLLVIQLFALVLTFSRGAWLAFLVGFMILMACYKKDRASVAHATIVFLCTIFLLSWIFREPLLTRLQGAQRLEVQSRAERIEQLQKFELTALGVGAGNSVVAISSRASSDLRQPIHNIYLLISTELGVIGFFIFLLFFFFVIFYCWKHKSYFGLSLVSSMAILGLFDHYLWTLYFGVMLFWITISLSLRAGGAGRGV